MIYPEGTLDYPSAEAERLLPLSRVYVLAIEDFERFTSAVANAQIDVPAFLASCVEDDNKPNQALLLFEQHLNRRKVPLKFSDLVEHAIDDGMSRLENALSA